jgi:cytochrome c oxidase subunit 1
LAGMPRRYSDFPDAYFVWNFVARIGSLISLVGVIYFFGILWEAFVRHRGVLIIISSESSVELRHSSPPINHRYERCPKLFN